MESKPLTPVRWSFPEELDARETAFDVDEPWADDATGQPARHPLRPFVWSVLEFLATVAIVLSLLALLAPAFF
jgi:hypothetical protein